jgi:hypothetical protein
MEMRPRLCHVQMLENQQALQSDKRTDVRDAYEFVLCHVQMLENRQKLRSDKRTDVRDPYEFVLGTS